MLTINDITIDPLDPYPFINPPLFDDYVFIVIGEDDEQASAPDALGDLWDLLRYTNNNLVISSVILEEEL